MDSARIGPGGAPAGAPPELRHRQLLVTSAVFFVSSDSLTSSPASAIARSLCEPLANVTVPKVADVRSSLARPSILETSPRPRAGPRRPR